MLFPNKILLLSHTVKTGKKTWRHLKRNLTKVISKQKCPLFHTVKTGIDLEEFLNKKQQKKNSLMLFPNKNAHFSTLLKQGKRLRIFEQNSKRIIPYCYFLTKTLPFPHC